MIHIPPSNLITFLIVISIPYLIILDITSYLANYRYVSNQEFIDIRKLHKFH